jgi:hypothetical protein
MAHGGVPMIDKRGEGSSSSVAIFAIVVVVLIAIFAFAAYSYGYFPIEGKTDTIIIQDKTPSPVVIREKPTIIENNFNNTVIVNAPLITNTSE